MRRLSPDRRGFPTTIHPALPMTLIAEAVAYVLVAFVNVVEFVVAVGWPRVRQPWVESATGRVRAG